MKYIKKKDKKEKNRNRIKISSLINIKDISSKVGIENQRHFLFFFSKYF